MALRRALRLVGAVGALSLVRMPIGEAQEVSAVPIRVESNQVVVPVVVLDQVKLRQLQRMDPVEFAKEAREKQLEFVRGIAVGGMTVEDFQLFEDGREENVRSLVSEPQFQAHVKDNLGEHLEAIGVGGGIWSISELQVPELNLTKRFSVGRHNSESESRAIVKVAAWPGYLMAYTPPVSAAGSCHQVMVQTHRANALVYARSEYCRPNDSTVDALNDTSLGRRMRSDLASQRRAEILLSLAATPLFVTGP
jgi:hypothetical protein